MIIFLVLQNALLMANFLQQFLGLIRYYYAQSFASCMLLLYHSVLLNYELDGKKVTDVQPSSALDTRLI